MIRRLFVLWALGAAACSPTAPDTDGQNGLTYAVDAIEVDKSARQMRMLHQGRVVRTYAIALGRDPIGHKEREGDSRTPEGSYFIDTRNPESRFGLSIRISYPDAKDHVRAARQGFDPGGDIFIHGLPNRLLPGEDRFYANRDWTDGCIAVTNGEMREIYHSVKDGTPITIRP